MDRMNDKISGFIRKRRRNMQNLGRDLGWMLRLNKKVLQNARGARIIAYHGICRIDPLRYNTLFLTQKTLENQLKLYKKHFNIISLDDYYYGRFSNDRFSICITFDDGFANNYEYVLPLLEQYQAPATFFITGIRDAGYSVLWNDVLSLSCIHGPGKIVLNNQEFMKGRYGRYQATGSKSFLADLLRSEGFKAKEEMIKLLYPYVLKAQEEYWMQMTTEQIRIFSQSKWVTIGSHGFYHNDLARIPLKDARDEMIRSRNYLEKIISKEVKALAFPYGAYNTEILTEATNAGYTQLLTTAFAMPEDAHNNLLKERLIVNPFISVYNQLCANIYGNYDQ